MIGGFSKVGLIIIWRQ